MCVNERRRKNYIHILNNGPDWVMEHEEKELQIFQHFSETMKRGQQRTSDFNWPAMNFSGCDLSSLGDPFVEEAALAAIKALPWRRHRRWTGLPGPFLRHAGE